MSRNFKKSEYIKRKKLIHKAFRIEEAMNKFIAEAYDAWFPPDVSMWVMPEVCRPVIKISFFRDFDSIQNK